MEYYSAIKKEWNNAIFNNMDGPRDYHTKWRSQRKTNIIYHLYVESKKKWYKWTYLQNQNRLTDLENELMVTGGKSGGKGYLGSLELTCTHGYI